ncbi:MAG TPA: prenyltransferase/squalene oxidase repeat-containing protein [Phycisphaerae bacterium]|nr:prenyltransferase/squalene oxidase repeat-containing protein [Phycisphaerae bacterium]HQL71536.1 prenyltransferase/squalene oxidase repeat-containing protein [Phycisphaerae bacterium]
MDQALAGARAALLEERVAGGHWEGELCSSALSTATAVVALAQVDREKYAAQIRAGLDWLAAHANDDGGWGDTTRSLSNISTTVLCWSAFACQSQRCHPQAKPGGADADVVQRAGEWIAARAGSLEPDALAAAIYARYGQDKTFSAPILSLCAIAGRLGEGRRAWRHVAQLPFELAVLPHGLFRFLNLRVVSYALPALIAIGLARHRRRPTPNPLARAVRWAATGSALGVLERIQPQSGGFLEAAPLTSFVVMNLVAAGRADHAVVRRGVEFLLASVRPDGSWPIDTNLATWVTTLSLGALSAGSAGRATFLSEALSPQERSTVQEWLLGQQYGSEHPYTHADPGGWAWTNLSGAVPDADDTSGALLALHHLVTAGHRSVRQTHIRHGRRLSSHNDGQCLDRHVADSAARGLEWLMGLQNRDGGIPTFCRGWGKLPFDRSSNDLTAHALAAMDAWIDELDGDDSAAAPALPASRLEAVPRAAPPRPRYRPAGQEPAEDEKGVRNLFLPVDPSAKGARAGHQEKVPDPFFAAGARTGQAARVEAALRRGAGFLTAQQRLDGAWAALWFGCQHARDEENLTYGTARVLLSLQRLARRWNCVDADVIRRGRDYLLNVQNADGGWGGQADAPSTIEETALAVDALCGPVSLSETERGAVRRGAAWLIDRTDGGKRFEPSPIGFYFAKLWYYEKLYPVIFTASALAAARAALGGD